MRPQIFFSSIANLSRPPCTIIQKSSAVCWFSFIISYPWKTVVLHQLFILKWQVKTDFLSTRAWFAITLFMPGVSPLLNAISSFDQVENTIVRQMGRLGGILRFSQLNKLNLKPSVWLAGTFGLENMLREDEQCRQAWPEHYQLWQPITSKRKRAREGLRVRATWRGDGFRQTVQDQGSLENADNDRGRSTW